VVTLVAFACGSSSGPAGSKGTIKIGSDLPVCTVGGQAVQNGVQFAVNQKNAAGGVNGYTVQFQGFDDCRQGSYNADAGSRTSEDAGRQQVPGHTVPTTRVAKAEIPIAAPQHFVMITRPTPARA
jgi:branched-chain amino acid transport system substrate-binding protein